MILGIVQKRQTRWGTEAARRGIGPSGRGRLQSRLAALAAYLVGLLAGLDLPSAGRVHIDGTDLSALNEDGRATLRRRLVGFVFQSFQLLPALTALENVMLPMELAGARDARDAARALLTRVGLAPRLDHYPRQLSGGEQQRVALARAVAREPGLLLADEPTGNLDSATGAQIIELLLALNRERGSTLVLVTHDPVLAAQADRQVALRDGRVVGSTERASVS